MFIVKELAYMDNTLEKPQDQQWTKVITPKRKFFSFDFKELWRYRDLYSIYVNMNITTVYKQTILGSLSNRFFRP